MKPPATADVTVSPGLEARLGLYGDGWDLVLAPVGWWCQASIGMDGGSIVRIWSPTDHEAQVNRSGEPSCYGCVLSLACSVFASANRQLDHEGFGPCDPQPPARELVRSLTSELISFTDPPQVSGTGDGSGGAYRADGLVWFTNVDAQLSAAKITCALSSKDHDLCDVIVDYFKSTLPDPASDSGPAVIASFGPNQSAAPIVVAPSDSVIAAAR